MRSRNHALDGLALAFVALLVSVPLRADLLKTRDGAVIETKGAWTVKGRQVVFTRPNGTLSSMRLDEVDLTASEAATAAANRPAPEPSARPSASPPRRAPVLVLTNADVPKARPAPQEVEDDTKEGLLDPASPLAEGSVVKVVGWNASYNEKIGGLEVFGTVQNQGRDIAIDLSLGIDLFDDDGESIGSGAASLTATTLAPRASTGFRAFFPGLTSHAATTRFKLRRQGVEIAAAEPRDDEPRRN